MAKEVSLPEPVLSPCRSGKVGYALPEPILRIVDFYTTAQVGDEEDSDDESGNDFRHEVPSIRVAAAKGAAQFKTKNQEQSSIA